MNLDGYLMSRDTTVAEIRSGIVAPVNEELLPLFFVNYPAHEEAGASCSRDLRHFMFLRFGFFVRRTLPAVPAVLPSYGQGYS